MGDDMDDMDSLFEGMVLVSQDQNQHLPQAPPSPPPQPPLDENMFSDLTIINPLQTLDDPPSTSSSLVSRQISRKKKKGAVGFRIEYGRSTSFEEDIIDDDRRDDDSRPSDSTSSSLLLDPMLSLIGRKRLSLGDSWLVYDGETAVNPRFSVRKHVNFMSNKSLAYVTSLLLPRLWVAKSQRIRSKYRTRNGAARCMMRRGGEWRRSSRKRRSEESDSALMCSA